MLIIEDKGNNHNGEKMDILNQKANRECSIFKIGLNLDGKSSTFPSSELISQKGAYSMSADYY